jgi:hypothetical protein
MHPLESVDYLQKRVDEDIIPQCAELRDFIQTNKTAFDTIAKEFLAELVNLFRKR